MCIVVGWEGMLREGRFVFKGGVGGVGGGGVMFMCLLYGIEGVGEREVGVWGVAWMMCWGCCVVWGLVQVGCFGSWGFFVVMVGCAGMWCALSNAVLGECRVCRAGDMCLMVLVYCIYVLLCALGI